MNVLVPKLSATTLPWPTDWDAVFGTSGQNRPLILEIGFGQGEFLRHLSQTYPDANIVGLEISHISMEKAEKAIARGIIPNVRVVFTYAETALQHLFEPQSIDKVFINYPDPWFKDRHGHRRLMKRTTLDALVSRLKPGGELYLATDIIEYAEMSHALLADTPALINRFDTPWRDTLEGRIVTKYERIAHTEGRSGHYFAYIRDPNAPAHLVPDVPTIKDLDMPNIVLEVPLTPDEIIQSYQRFEEKHGELNVSYKNIYRGDRGLLIEVYVSEPTIEQRCTLLINQDYDNPHLYTVRVGTIGSPRPTEGMHLAVRGFAEWMHTLHPDAKILQDKVKKFYDRGSWANG